MHPGGSAARMRSSSERVMIIDKGGRVTKVQESPIIADVSLVNEALRLEIEMNMTGEHVARMSSTFRAPMLPRRLLEGPEQRVHKSPRVVQQQEHHTPGSPQSARRDIALAL